MDLFHSEPPPQLLHAQDLALEHRDLGPLHVEAARSDKDPASWEAGSQLVHSLPEVRVALKVHVDAVKVLRSVNGPKEALEALEVLVDDEREGHRERSLFLVEGLVDKTARAEVIATALRSRQLLQEGVRSGRWWWWLHFGRYDALKRVTPEEERTVGGADLHVWNQLMCLLPFQLLPFGPSLARRHLVRDGGVVLEEGDVQVDGIL